MIKKQHQDKADIQKWLNFQKYQKRPTRKSSNEKENKRRPINNKKLISHNHVLKDVSNPEPQILSQISRKLANNSELPQ